MTGQLVRKLASFDVPDADGTIGRTDGDASTVRIPSWLTQ